MFTSRIGFYVVGIWLENVTCFVNNSRKNCNWSTDQEQMIGADGLLLLPWVILKSRPVRKLVWASAWQVTPSAAPATGLGVRPTQTRRTAPGDGIDSTDPAGTWNWRVDPGRFRAQLCCCEVYNDNHVALDTHLGCCALECPSPGPKLYIWGCHPIWGALHIKWPRL